MYSSKELERFYFQYQTETLPHGESNRIVLRTKFLVTSFKNGLRIECLHKYVVRYSCL